MPKFCPALTVKIAALVLSPLTLAFWSMQPTSVHIAANSSGPHPSSTLFFFFLLHFSPAVTCLQPCGLALDAVMDNFAIPDEWEGGVRDGWMEGGEGHAHTHAAEPSGDSVALFKFLLMLLTSAIQSFILSFFLSYSLSSTAS